MFQQKIFREDKKNEFKALVDAWLESKKTKEQIENAKKLLSDIDISSIINLFMSSIMLDLVMLVNFSSDLAAHGMIIQHQII